VTLRTGSWKPADIGKDLAAMEKFLTVKDGDAADTREWLYRSGDMGRVLLSLCHFHRAGYTNEANRLAHTMFQAAPDRRALLLSAVNALAESRYDETCNAFFTTGDWKRYHADLKKLLATYRTGWRSVPVVERLVGKVAARCGMTEFPLPNGKALDEADRKLAMALVTEPGAKVVGGGNIGWVPWTLASEEDADEDEEEKDDDAEPSLLNGIMRRGMGGVSLLIALLGDECLTRVDCQQLRGASYGRHGFSGLDSFDMDEDVLDAMYASMRRPVTRGEIARCCLEPVVLLPDVDEYDRDEVDDETFQEACQGWYERCKSMDRAELARLYLAEGNSGQKRCAFDLMSDSDDPEDRKRIEAFMIEGGDDAEDEVLEYVLKLGPDARDFVTRYAAALTGGVSEAGGDLFRGEERESGAEDALKELWAIVNARPPGEILEDVLSGKTNLDAVATCLQSQLGRGDRAAALTTVLEAALRATNAALSSAILQYSESLIVVREWERGPGSCTMVTKAPPLPIASHAPLWRKLLDDQRVIESGDLYDEITTIADQAASLIEDGYSASEETALNEDEYIYMRGHMALRCRDSLGRRGREAVGKAALARVNGADTADLPKIPATVSFKASEEDVKALAGRLEQAGASGIRDAVDALTFEELMLLPRAIGTNQTLNVLFAPMACEITVVHHSFEASGDLSKLEALKGKPLTPDTIRTVADVCGQLCRPGHPVGIGIRRSVVPDGVAIVVRRATVSNRDDGCDFIENRGRDSSLQAGRVAATMWRGRKRTQASWPVGETGRAAHTAAVPAETPEDALLDAMASELDRAYAAHAALTIDRFWKSVAEVFEKPETLCRPLRVQFWAMAEDEADAEKGREGNE